jgi:hypothetical protein
MSQRVEAQTPVIARPGIAQGTCSRGDRGTVHARDEHERAQAEHELIEREIEQDRTECRRLAAVNRFAIRIAGKVSSIRLRTT